MVWPWALLSIFVGMLAGAASAVFLWLLHQATSWRESHDWLVFFLPVAGIGIGLVYESLGKGIEGGNNLVIDSIHDGGTKLPLRMTPLVLLGTVLTHLFGGSAGREGTAVQMGASLAEGISHRLLLGPQLRRHLLIAGVAGGFGSIFGTPIAGAVFGLEFVVLGRIEYRSLGPALIAALVGDLTARALGAEHTSFPLVSAVPMTPVLLLQWLAFATAIAAVTVLFVELTHAIRREGQRLLTRLPIRLFCGGCAFVGLWQTVGSNAYLGLSIPSLLQAFSDPRLPIATFAFKLLFTVITLGAGFLGGEVTPLFVIGATLGNVLARLLGLPLDLGAGVGMAAAFAAGSNTPLALSLMAVELLGGALFPHVTIVCVAAYLMTGQRSIYSAQRVVQSKLDSATMHGPTPLRELVERRKSDFDPENEKET